ncbi:hypothetical protein [Leptospira bandrabouensis]|uniref:Uncharacterized protein n=1 Tax=Leptospira bandrabouensis TaxID=2484903 RepID=A0A6H3NLB8_9LEPT|nr:hypothetical protein [Leptospira bandrabouensis]MCG6154070.1 hypothetical protein [Leptospira bandrabouensis]TGN10293.1 hypothetical protein EHR08_19475 [Leptospira bandrabouensis]
MISKFAKIIFVLTSLAPVLISLSLSLTDSSTEIRISLILLALILFLLAKVTLEEIAKNGEIEPIKIISLKTADHEVLAYLVTYLVPFLASISVQNAIIIYTIIFISIYNSNAYHFNPLIGLLKYHFYQIETESNVSYILITKKEIRNVQMIKHISHITDYLVIDKDIV